MYHPDNEDAQELLRLLKDAKITFPLSVKKPGQHGKGFRVVHPFGITVKGKEVFEGIAEVLAYRSSEDNFSDMTEAARAAYLAKAGNVLPIFVEAARLSLAHLLFAKKMLAGVGEHGITKAIEATTSALDSIKPTT